MKFLLWQSNSVFPYTYLTLELAIYHNPVVVLALTMYVYTVVHTLHIFFFSFCLLFEIYIRRIISGFEFAILFAYDENVCYGGKKIFHKKEKRRKIWIYKYGMYFIIECSGKNVHHHSWNCQKNVFQSIFSIGALYTQEKYFVCILIYISLHQEMF